MRAKTLCIFALAAAIVATLPPGASGDASPRGGAPVGLFNVMEDMQSMVLALKKDGTDPEKIAQNLKTLAQFERDVAMAKMQRPPVDRVQDQEKGLLDYRKAMTALQRTALDLEDAVIGKKPDEIKKLIARFDTLEDAGHDEFR